MKRGAAAASAVEPIDEIAAALASALCDVLKRHGVSLGGATPSLAVVAPERSEDPLLDREGIARCIGLSDASGVYEYSRRRARDPLPVFRIGRHLRARRSEVEAWIERQRVKR